MNGFLCLWRSFHPAGRLACSSCRLPLLLLLLVLGDCYGQTCTQLNVSGFEDLFNTYAGSNVLTYNAMANNSKPAFLTDSHYVQMLWKRPDWVFTLDLKQSPLVKVTDNAAEPQLICNTWQNRNADGTYSPRVVPVTITCLGKPVDRSHCIKHTETTSKAATTSSTGSTMTLSPSSGTFSTKTSSTTSIMTSTTTSTTTSTMTSATTSTTTSTMTSATTSTTTSTMISATTPTTTSTITSATTSTTTSTMTSATTLTTERTSQASKLSTSSETTLKIVPIHPSTSSYNQSSISSVFTSSPLGNVSVFNNSEPLPNSGSQGPSALVIGITASLLIIVVGAVVAAVICLAKRRWRTFVLNRSVNTQDISPLSDFPKTSGLDKASTEDSDTTLYSRNNCSEAPSHCGPDGT